PQIGWTKRCRSARRAKVKNILLVSFHGKFPVLCRRVRAKLPKLHSPGPRCQPPYEQRKFKSTFVWFRYWFRCIQAGSVFGLRATNVEVCWEAKLQRLKGELLLNAKRMADGKGGQADAG